MNSVRKYNTVWGVCWAIYRALCHCIVFIQQHLQLDKNQGRETGVYMGQAEYSASTNATMAYTKCIAMQRFSVYCSARGLFSLMHLSRWPVSKRSAWQPERQKGRKLAALRLQVFELVQSYTCAV